jgi:hypothetical protein
VLGGRTDTSPVAFGAIQVRPGPVRVQLESGATALRGPLAGVAGIVLVDTGGDLVVGAEAGGYRLGERSGVLVAEKPLSAPQAVMRIAAEPDVRHLANSTSPSQRARIELAPYQDGARSHQGVFVNGQKFDLMLRSSAQVWPLVVDIDVTGFVTVLYPLPKAKDPVPAGVLLSLGADGVDPPFGVEYLKAFAFDRKPEGYDSWAGQAFPATDSRLKQLLAFTAQGVGDAVYRLITRAGD